jgi:hypothetical protein
MTQEGLTYRGPLQKNLSQNRLKRIMRQASCTKPRKLFGYLTAFAIVREREVGTLEQIMVTPIRPSEFIVGKMVPFFIVGWEK